MISANVSNHTRKAVYARDHYRCALCDSNRGIQIHHVIKRSQGGGGTNRTTSSPCACTATRSFTGPGSRTCRTGWTRRN